MTDKERVNGDHVSLVHEVEDITFIGLYNSVDIRIAKIDVDAQTHSTKKKAEMKVRVTICFLK